jgi:hypothetical protein
VEQQEQERDGGGGPNNENADRAMIGIHASVRLLRFHGCHPASLAEVSEGRFPVFPYWAVGLCPRLAR